MTTDPRDDLIAHLPAMRAFALSLTRDPIIADDIVQDAVEKAWRCFDMFEAGTNLRAWLFTILRNTYYSSRRRAMREISKAEAAQLDGISDKSPHDAPLQMVDFRWAFAQLSDEQREALLLVGASGFSYEEAADMCGVPIGTIKSRTGRARQRLAALMQIEEDSTPDIPRAQGLSAVPSAKAASF